MTARQSYNCRYLNPPALNDTIQFHLDETILEKFAGVEHLYHQTTVGGHGRIDTRPL